MKTIPNYLHIGVQTYKTKRIARGEYSVWHCKDICSLKYMGQWTQSQLLKSLKHGELM